jgi:hypothetical protein
MDDKESLKRSNSVTSPSGFEVKIKLGLVHLSSKFEKAKKKAKQTESQMS